MEALVLSEHNLAAWRHAYKLGSRPSVLPYGVERLEKHDISVTYGTSREFGFSHRVLSALEYRVGMPLELPLRSLGLAKHADFVVALLERNASLPSLLKARGISAYSNRPLIAFTCWLAESACRASSDRERRLVRRPIDAADLVVYLSRNQTGVLKELGIDDQKLLPVPFGIDANFYSPSRTIEDVEVLAVGKDRGRDYKTLFQAARDQTFSVDVFCSFENIRNMNPPKNVRIHSPVNHVNYRDLLRRAKVVVVPTRELAYPTGQSVALEASACGKCVIVTGTTPMQEYFQHESNALLAPPGDDSELQRLIRLALDDPDLRSRIGSNARTEVLTNFTTQHMWDAVLHGMRERGLY